MLLSAWSRTFAELEKAILEPEDFARFQKYVTIGRKPQTYVGGMEARR